MALKPVLDSLDGLPEPLKAEYEQHDGKFHLSMELADDSPWRPIVKLTGALASERSGRSAEKGQIATLKRDLASMTTARDEAATKATELEARAGQAGSETNQAFEQYKAAQETRIKALETGITDERAKREKAEQDMARGRFVDEVRKEAAPFVRDEAGVLDDFIDRKVLPHFKLNEKGEYVPYDGETVAFSLKDMGKPMPIKEFLAERALKDPSAGYMLRQSRGAGAPGNNGTVFPGASQFTIKRGAPPAEYQRVRDAADKAGQSLQVID